MAIAFSTATSLTTTTGLTSTTSHTISGSNNILWVGVYTAGASTDVVTGITYAGASMTRAFTMAQGSNARFYMYYIVNPNAGANDVVVTKTGVLSMGGVAASYTGASQTGVPDATAPDANNSGTDAFSTLTTVADNAWIIGLCWTNRDNSNNTGTIRGGVTSQFSLFDSNGAKSPAGSYPLGITMSSSSTWATKSVSFAPSIVVANTGAGFFGIM